MDRLAKHFPQLLYDRVGSQIASDVEMQDSASPVFYNKEAIQDLQVDDLRLQWLLPTDTKEPPAKRLWVYDPDNGDWMYTVAYRKKWTSRKGTLLSKPE